MLRLIAPSLILASATSALAGEASQQGSLQASFTDLRTKCSEFAANPQMKPVSAKLHCSEQQFLWRAVDPHRASLKNFRQVGAQLDLKTFSTPQEFVQAAAEETWFGCPTFLKVQRDVPALEVELSCADFLNITDLHSFCEAEIARRVKLDPGIVEEKSTGETLQFCPKNASK